MVDPLEFAVSLALETGELLQNYYNSVGIHTKLKPDKTVVTEADLAADNLITRKIKAAFPQDAIVSEESFHFLRDTQSPAWVVDPLDGTTNYSLGLPVWGISIARLIGGYPDLGVVFFPRLNELYSTHRGAGAFLNHNPISTRAPDRSQPMSFFACCSRTFRHFNISVPYKPRIMGSSAYSFCMVARGSALLGFDATPKIWDLSAVWLLVEEAGGVIQSFESTQVYPLNTDLDYSINSFPVIAAATLKVLEKGRGMILRK
jgi:myo-inositol-1(or 4)-monophosphatase